MRRVLLIVGFCGLSFLALTAQRGAVEVFQVGPADTDQLPRGKEAEGIIGDYVLRNDKVELTISGVQPMRRANFKTDSAGPLQGCVYDFDLRGAANDQLTVFRPGGFGGEVSHVRIVEDGSDGAAVIEAVKNASQADGVYTKHEYRLESGWSHLLVTSTYRNEATEAKSIAPRAIATGLINVSEVGEAWVGDSVDAFDKRSYAWGDPEASTTPESLTLEAGQEKVFRTALTVADSPAAAYGALAAFSTSTGHVTGSALDPDGTPAVDGALLFKFAGVELPHYPDAAGKIALVVPADDYAASFVDIGRPTRAVNVKVRAGEESEIDLALPRASAIRFAIRDESGEFLPAKVQFIGVNGTETPNFGTDYRTRGGNHQYQTHTGRFTQQVPAGEYLLRISRGPEYDIEERRLRVAEAKLETVDVVLQRTVDTAGWVSTDFHAHSTPSGDNYCGTNDRIINFAAEHLEFVPTTEHNRIYDWEPYIRKLGLLKRMKTVPGMELTGSGQHFNAFPLTPAPFTQDGGAPVWDYDPRINALHLRNWVTPGRFEGGTYYDTAANARLDAPKVAADPDRWVQANHPTVGEVFFDRNKDGIEDGGFVGFEDMLDAAEVWSAEILNLNPRYKSYDVQNRTFGWLQMLNQGRHVWCVAVSDAHRIFNNGVGGWRSYVPSSTDEPAEIDHREIIRNAKAGRMMITNGPFLEVTTGDGLPIGSSIRSSAPVVLKIKVQAANWLDVDRVQILVNGRQPERYNFTRISHPGWFKDGVVRFDQTVAVELQRDSHLIVVATDEDSDVSKLWGLDRNATMPPVAYTNPIYVDVDGGGFTANGDTLGHPLLTAND